MSTLSTVNTENLMSEPFITEFSHVFFNAGTKKFPKSSLSLEVTNNKDMITLKKICEGIEPKTPFKPNKENTKLYCKFNISSKLKVYNESRKVIDNADLEEMLKVKDGRIIFTVNKYTMAGVSGISFKCQQIQLKDKEDKYKDCLFGN